eukprot:354588-Chlamydomonas_euryale.AAC.2
MRLTLPVRGICSAPSVAVWAAHDRHGRSHLKAAGPPTSARTHQPSRRGLRRGDSAEAAHRGGSARASSGVAHKQTDMSRSLGLFTPR